MLEFDWKLRVGQQMIRYMNYATKLELKRLWRQMGPLSYQYFYPLMDDYMQANTMDKPKMIRLWTWDDSSKIVNFIDCHFKMVERYGLNYPAQCQEMVTKQELKTREDELVDYFLYEMRKPAAEQ